MFLLIDHLLIGEGSEGLGVPVDHTDAAIDQTLIVEVAEDADYGSRASLIHGEGGAIPVARGSELTELLEDDTSILIGPIPGVGEELLTSKGMLIDTLLGELSHDFSLGRYGSMVGAGNPASVLAGHTGTTHQYILNSIIQHVAHVEHAGDIRGWNHYGIRFTIIGGGMEKTMIHPILIPLILNIFRIVYGS